MFYYGKQCLSLDKDDKVVVIALAYAYMRANLPLQVASTDSEDFTSDSKASWKASVSSESSAEELDVMILDEVPDKIPLEQELIDAKLTHLTKKIRRSIKKMFSGKGLIDLSQHDICPSEVPAEHDFELKNDEPIYHKPLKCHPSYLFEGGLYFSSTVNTTEEKVD